MGWHASVMMGFQAHGRVAAGARPAELAVPAVGFMEALKARGDSVRGALNLG